MLFATTTIRSMEKKITLETLAVNIADLTSLVSGQGFKLEAQGSKLDALSDKVDSLSTKIDRIDLTTHAIQEDTESIHQEMKGIHKVLDKFDGRVTRLEIHAGFPIETAEEQPSAA